MALVSFQEPLLRSSGVAELFDISEKTLSNWRVRGEGPIGYKLGPNGPVRYRREDVEKWLEENREVGK